MRQANSILVRSMSPPVFQGNGSLLPSRHHHHHRQDADDDTGSLVLLAWRSQRFSKPHHYVLWHPALCSVPVVVVSFSICATKHNWHGNRLSCDNCCKRLGGSTIRLYWQPYHVTTHGIIAIICASP